MICPTCQRPTAAETGYLLCRHCGANLYANLLDHVPTKPLPGTRHRTHHMPSLMHDNPLLLYVQDGSVPISVERSAKVILGRSDPQVYFELDVDLVDYLAHQHGVSRRHALLDATHDIPMLTDLQSYNGTFVNGNRLTPERAVGLRSGDEIRLGRLILRVYFQ